MFDLVSQNPMIALADKGMSLATQRIALIASNLANIDTPGYRTKDFDFAAAFQTEMEKLDRQFSPTPGSPASPAEPGITPPAIIHPVDITSERNDGNDVHLDRENMLLTQTQSVFTLSSNLAQGELRLVLGAIRDAAK
ncbi:flagellar basal body rod protein FlgB [Mesoterricola silvestris]|uniref:Flagellar basal body rod protein FlgB n=1 Tax=Mesoterricola silvestris TaxID=2927979 RepID=A0AA48K9L5_9BACT|nr:flagellar basal body rod protein FlgB [Mesoterricola silvestris]BDU73626.1 flagellar basal body rod protein FlgB [Mesoterricola silvestris]